MSIMYRQEQEACETQESSTVAAEWQLYPVCFACGPLSSGEWVPDKKGLECNLPCFGPLHLDPILTGT
jgi:hypothetical protein